MTRTEKNIVDKYLDSYYNTLSVKDLNLKLSASNTLRLQYDHLQSIEVV